MTGRPPNGQAPTMATNRYWGLLLTLLVVVSIFLCAIMAFFFNPRLDQMRNNPSARLTGHSFSNLYEGALTRNGGGWDLDVRVVTGPKVSLRDLVIVVKAPASSGGNATVWRFSVKGSGTNASDLSYEGSTSHSYIRAYNRTAVPLRFANGSVPEALDQTTAPGLTDGTVTTVEGAIMVFRDTDLNGNLTDGDKVTVFRDIDADGVVELGTGTLLELQTVDGKLISSAILK